MMISSDWEGVAPSMKKDSIFFEQRSPPVFVMNSLTAAKMIAGSCLVNEPKMCSKVEEFGSFWRRNKGMLLLVREKRNRLNLANRL